VGRRFRVDDRTRQLEWLATYSLGTLISSDDDGWPRASSMPLIVRPDEQGRERLYGHLDRRNPQAEHLERGKPLLYVAYGPRAYVSPGWFPRRPAAPTYLHVTVHVRGRAKLLDHEQTKWVLLETVETFEQRQPEPWSYDSGERFLDGMAKGVVAFELQIEATGAARKLSQDRDQQERTLIADRLAASDRDEDRAIAEMLREI
jgi:transcriptional regulator